MFGEMQFRNGEFLQEFRRIEQLGVDREAGIIRGINVLESGLVAKGHGLTVDDKTIATVLASAKGRKIGCKVNHGSGLSNLVGHFTNFRVDGRKLRADLVVLQSAEHRDLIFEAAERQPETFGGSIAFAGDPEVIGDLRCARCRELKAIDLVVDPAAVSDGLFSAGPVDNNSRATTMDTEQLLAQLQKQNQLLEQQIQFNAQIDQRLTQFEDSLVAAAEEVEDEPDLEDLLEGRVDADGTVNLEGLTLEEIGALEDSGLLEIQDSPEPDDVSDNEPDMDGVEAEFAAMRERIVELENRLSADDERRTHNGRQAKFAAIEQKISLLGTQLVRVTAERDALRAAIKGSGNMVAFSEDSGWTLDTKRGGQPVHQFMAMVEEAHAADPATPKSTHFDRLKKKHRDIWEDYYLSQSKKS
jgi:hypothetical protein